MREYTTDEIKKALLGCSKHEGCDNCIEDYRSWDCINSLERKAAILIEAQQKEIAELKKQIADYDLNGQIRARDEPLKRRKERNVLLEEEIEKLKWDNAALEATIENQRKQIAETYTAEQFIQDARRMIDKDYPAWLVRHMTDNPQDESNYVREWATSHPEKPKVTNGDKFKEVFGRNPKNDFCLRPEPKCIHAEDATTCNHCDYGCNGEYKVPSDK